MKDTPISSAAPATDNGVLDFLTIDADAHLHKLTAHMFPAPELLPVELVRAALKRKAGTVVIQSYSSRLVLSDDGEGIDADEWRHLACAGDTAQPAAARENAIAAIHGRARPGIGMLASFLPGARLMRIENAHADGKSTLQMAAGRVGLHAACSLSRRGTRITIFRRRGPAAKEQALLRELCAAVPTEIVINGRPLEKKALLSRSLASMEFHNENSLPSLLAIPAQGDVCRIYLLDQNIPWQVSSMAPVQGMVFAAAVESREQLSLSTLAILTSAAGRLYRWLAEQHSTFPEKYQDRIEDLFFKLVRAGGDEGLLSVCQPFRLWHAQRRLPLDEVRRQAACGILYALDHDCVVRGIGQAASGILLLTARQKDFLLNHLHLPLVFLNEHMKAEKRGRSFFSHAWQKILCRLARPVLARAEILASERLLPEEHGLCLELEKYWQRMPAFTGAPPRTFPLAVVMIEGRGLLPAFCLETDRAPTLYIRRRHPWTLRVLRRVAENADNSEWALAALMPPECFDRIESMT